MDAAALKNLQAPIKQGYREHPETARITGRATASLDAPGVACSVDAFGRKIVAGLHPAAGGDGTQACSADLLLDALVACAGVTTRAVALASGIELRGGTIVAEGIWDARGTLGVDREAPVGLTEISMTFALDTDAPAEKVEKLIATVERYCVILQTLKSPPRISTRRAEG